MPETIQRERFDGLPPIFDSLYGYYSKDCLEN